MKLKYCLLAMLLLYLNLNAQIKINGVISDAETKASLNGATITLQTTGKSVIANENGLFKIKIPTYGDTLIVSNIGYFTKKLFVLENNSALVIELTQKANEVTSVVVSTGYQKISKERATGSFDYIDNKLFNRNVNPNVINHIENLTPGILFDRNTNAPDALLIRGRSTIYANAAPLIVLDNFPYDGDIYNINPNDVESITILKDAAAASIWGARAGNGVIVITTKKGTSSAPFVQLNTSLTFIGKPDLFTVNTISSSDFIDLEKYLFSQGYYNGIIASPDHQPLTPVTEILEKQKEGLISEQDANTQINNYNQFDVRNDIDKYLYKTGVNQQYNINVSGASKTINYYLSAGWDKNLPNLVGINNNRITIRNHTDLQLTDKLLINAGISYVLTNNYSGNNAGYNITVGGGKYIYPYATLEDNNAPVTLVKDYRTSWADTVGQGQLLNWKYNPVANITDEKDITKTNDGTLNLNLQYKITSYLNAEVLYQYEDAVSTITNLHTLNSYYTRNLINKYAQPDVTTSIYTFPIPKGGINDVGNSKLISHQGRAQINFQKNFGKHSIIALGGWEIKSVSSNGYTTRFYGYDADKNLINTNIDYVTVYPLLNSPFQQATVPSLQIINGKTDHFISQYANVGYTYKARYALSASAREDEANLFGVKANQKGTPLWSIGGLWQLSKENFYKLKFLPSLQLKVSCGYNGNISRVASAFTTASYYGAITTPAVSAEINNPPNDALTWEQIKIFNAGIEFQFIKNVISGSVEYYKKRSTNLIGQAPVDPTLGLSNGSQNLYYGNVAGMRDNGIDIDLSSNNIKGRLSWSTNFIASFTNSKVTKYLIPQSTTGSTYLPEGLGFINPVVGKPVFAIYSFAWAGLDGATGNPLGYYQGKTSTDYAGIYNNTPLDSLTYNGPAQPTFFGSLRNEFFWKGLSFSFNISFKGGYYFRTHSLSYSDLYSSWTGSGDYAKRWQQPGDEKNTYVPSRTYPSDINRDAFYQNSSILVEKGDNIRLEDISISYALEKTQWKAMPLRSLKLYMYLFNLGTIYLANSRKIDPYYNNVPANGKSLSIGLTASF